MRCVRFGKGGLKLGGGIRGTRGLASTALSSGSSRCFADRVFMRARTHVQLAARQRRSRPGAEAAPKRRPIGERLSSPMLQGIPCFAGGRHGAIPPRMPRGERQRAREWGALRVQGMLQLGAPPFLRTWAARASPGLISLRSDLDEHRRHGQYSLWLSRALRSRACRDEPGLKIRLPSWRRRMYV